MRKTTKKFTKRQTREKPLGVIEFALDPDAQCGDPIPKEAPWPFARCERWKDHDRDVHATTGGRPAQPWNVHYWPVEDLPE